MDDEEFTELSREDRRMLHHLVDLSASGVAVDADTTEKVAAAVKPVLTSDIEGHYGPGTQDMLDSFVVRDLTRDLWTGGAVWGYELTDRGRAAAEWSYTND